MEHTVDPRTPKIGRLLHGNYSGHTANCVMEYGGQSVGQWDSKPDRKYWCATHREWCYEYPIKITWTWADGSENEHLI